MKTAYLYIRVSTDEQAAKGYSQRNQQDRLVKFCFVHHIDVISSIFEDYSAKTFNRPAWLRMMKSFRRSKFLRPNLILFTKWDRFSRNAGDAYYMINQLQKLGIQPQAIEQELNFSIPENKILLGVYLATSEAENERRSINVKQGLRKAKKEGRWTAHAPLGYKSKIADDRKKIIIPSEPNASFIRKAFTLLAEDHLTAQSAFQRLIASGLKCSISNFRRILRNPVYCGRLIVPAYENEEAFQIKALHEPLVSQMLFDQVQELLNYKKTTPLISHKMDDQFLLRGVFHCPVCDRLLTGSASRSKLGRRYYYYHCISSCGYRIRSDKINNLFRQRLDELQIEKEYFDIYKEIIKRVRKDFNLNKYESRALLSASIDRLVERIVRAKELLMIGEIDEEDFLVIKGDCEQKIHTLGLNMQHSDEAQKRKMEGIHQMALELNEIGKTLADLTFIQKRGIIEVIIRRHPVMTPELEIRTLINPKLARIFGMVQLNNEISKKPNRNAADNWDELFKLNIAHKIADIEKQKGGSITQSEINEIMHFLALFANFTIKDSF